jgi:lipooligosaccharide transport system permease protein
MQKTLIYSWRVFKRNAKVFYKLYKMNLVINFIEPSIYLFAFGIGLGGLVSDIDGVKYINYIAPGMVAYSGLFAAAFESLFGTYTRMVHQKTFDAILATPVNPEGLILGEIWYASFKAVLFSAIILIVVYSARLIPTLWLISALPFVFLGGVTFSAMSLVVASFVKGIETFNYYVTLILTPLMLLSGVFFPLKGALEFAGNFSPFYHTAKICQYLAAGNVGTILFNVAFLFAMTVTSVTAALIFMKRRLAK